MIRLAQFSIMGRKKVSLGSAFVIWFNGSGMIEDFALKMPEARAEAPHYAIPWELETSVWSRLVTPQRSYAAQGSGLRFGVERHSHLRSYEGILSVKVHVENVIYQVDSTKRRGLAVGLGVGLTEIIPLGGDLTAHVSILVDPWRQMGVSSREAGMVNDQKVERSSLAVYAGGWGVEWGGVLEKQISLNLGGRAYPMFTRIGFHYRIVEYKKIVTKTIHSQEKRPTVIKQDFLTKHHVFLSLLTVGISL